jgi:hypothetical protein
VNAVITLNADTLLQAYANARYPARSTKDDKNLSQDRHAGCIAC